MYFLRCYTFWGGGGGGSNRVSRPSTLLNEKRAGDRINVNEVLRITLTMF